MVFALAGDVHRNSRALKQLKVFHQMGIEVDVLSMGRDRSAERHESFRIHYLPGTERTGARFFRHIHRVFTDAVAQLDSDIYHASDLYVLPAMVKAAKRSAAKVVFDARELYPYVASTVGRPWVSLFWNLFQDRYIKKADAVFTVSDSIADRLVESHGIPRPVVLFNVPEQQPFQQTDLLRQRTGIDTEEVIFLHQGQMRKDRGCEKLVQAMAGVSGAALVFLGNGPLKPNLTRLSDTLGLTNRVHFMDAVAPDVLLDYTASADIGVTLLEDTCLNHHYALPNKLFEYLMAGLPVLASNLPEIAGVVNGFEVGCVVNPEDEIQLIKTMQQMVDDAEARIRWKELIPTVFETFSWSKASERLELVYKSL
jgi:glycosyltransferase involved in cell wall biosynthesis